MNTVASDAPVTTPATTLPGAAPWRVLGGWLVIPIVLFLVHNYLIFWRDWPGALALVAHYQWLGFSPPAAPLKDGALTLGWIQFLSYPVLYLAFAAWVLASPSRSLRDDADIYSAISAYIVRAAFWAVLLVGLADMIISFLRVEELLERFVGKELTNELGRSIFRGNNVHYPLIALSMIIALFARTLGFIWLALLVVFAEFQIVISSFVFSYEQAFMGDLVRFWYAALFLFASAYTLVHDGHVRVDVIYTRFGVRGRARANLAGSLLLGYPFCWVILGFGMWSKGSSLNSPLLSYEISQSGFGMYTKYLMAGFLVIFAMSMAFQFIAYAMNSIADLRGDPGSGRDEPEVLDGH